MLAVVTEDGRYHGHVADESAAAGLTIVKDPTVHLLSEVEWDQVVNAKNFDERAKLCKILGKRP